MSILKTRGPLKRALFALATLGASLGAVTASSALGAPTASATTCATRGHAYLTQPATRSFIFSGFEGDRSVGIPTVNLTSGQWASFNTGGNGIRPGTSVTFNLWNLDHGVTFVRGIQTRTAGGNCVVNEQGARLLDYLAPGQYVLTANYFAGNSGQFINSEYVTYLAVQPAPPPPPVDSCGGLPAYFCGAGN
jgi:hypothetical protein